MKSSNIEKQHFKVIPSVREMLNIISYMFLAMKVDLELSITLWSEV